MHIMNLPSAFLFIFTSALAIFVTSGDRTSYPTYFVPDCNNLEIFGSQFTTEGEPWTFEHGTCTFDNINNGGASPTQIGAESLSIITLNSSCGQAVELSKSGLVSTYDAIFTTTFGEADSLQTQDNFQLICNVDGEVTIEPREFSASTRKSGYAQGSQNISFNDAIQMTLPKTEYKLGDIIVMTVNANLPSGYELSDPLSCYAASDENGMNRYYLITDRCGDKESTTVVTRGSGSLISVQFQAFNYKDIDSSQVYLFCEFYICENVGDTDARCTSCPSKRRRRNIQTSGQEHIAVKAGPFKIIQKTEVEAARIIPTKVRNAKIVYNRHHNHISQQTMKGINVVVLLSFFVSLSQLVLVLVVKKIYDMRLFNRSKDNLKTELLCKEYSTLRTL